MIPGNYTKIKLLHEQNVLVAPQCGWSRPKLKTYRIDTSILFQIPKIEFQKTECVTLTTTKRNNYCVKIWFQMTEIGFQNVECVTKTKCHEGHKKTENKYEKLKSNGGNELFCYKTHTENKLRQTNKQKTCNRMSRHRARCIGTQWSCQENNVGTLQACSKCFGIKHIFEIILNAFVPNCFCGFGDLVFCDDAAEIIINWSRWTNHRTMCDQLWP